MTEQELIQSISDLLEPMQDEIKSLNSRITALEMTVTSKQDHNMNLLLLAEVDLSRKL